MIIPPEYARFIPGYRSPSPPPPPLKPPTPRGRVYTDMRCGVPGCDLYDFEHDPFSLFLTHIQHRSPDEKYPANPPAPPTEVVISPWGVPYTRVVATQDEVS